uniref:Cytochrome b-c1 complex subunit 8 n=1 Tax=Hemiscolopendra marginata TaxID=943146 RepID=A0A646QGF4_9MYRI
MGKEFGQLAKIRGVVTFKLSPHELNPFKGIISHGFPNMIRRIAENIPYIGPPFIGTILLYNWAENEHERLQRKNPADYADEE